MRSGKTGLGDRTICNISEESNHQDTAVPFPYNIIGRWLDLSGRFPDIFGGRETALPSPHFPCYQW